MRAERRSGYTVCNCEVSESRVHEIKFRSMWQVSREIKILVVVDQDLKTPREKSIVARSCRRRMTPDSTRLAHDVSVVRSMGESSSRTKRTHEEATLPLVPRLLARDETPEAWRMTSPASPTLARSNVDTVDASEPPQPSAPFKSGRRRPLHRCPPGDLRSWAAAEIVPGRRLTRLGGTAP